MFNTSLVQIHKLLPKLRYLTALKIHCWGGLGSQLFAVALYFQLKNRFPKRSMILVLHDGGVTKRISEIEGIFSEISTMKIHDFSNPASKESTRPKSQRYVLRSIKGILEKFHVVLTLNSGDDFQSVLPWTLSIRGHYSYRRVSSNALALLLSRLSPAGKDRLQKDLSDPIQMGVHYRLGDLVNLASKSPLDVERVSQVLSGALSRPETSEIKVFSDSPEIAAGLFQQEMSHCSIVSEEMPTWETIGLLSRSQIFVGTFSKISIWIVILRYFSKDSKLSYMPAESQDNLELLLGAPLDRSRVVFYR
jgi:hypothetical protein